MSIYDPIDFAASALERAGWCINKNIRRHLIAGVCISTDRPLAGGRGLDVARHFIQPKKMPIPFLVNHDYSLATGVIHKLIPHGKILRFEGEMFNADSREWSVDPWGLVLLRQMLGVSVQPENCGDSFGFTIKEISLTENPADKGAAIDEIGALEPYYKLNDPSFKKQLMYWKSDRRKEELRREAEAVRRRGQTRLGKPGWQK